MKTPRKHAELIHQWADDEMAQVQSLAPDGKWIDVFAPRWSEDNEYRIKPTKPSIDWGHVKKYDWLATDENGSSFLFDGKPLEGSDSWLASRPIVSAECFASFKPGTCDWKESLVQRPEGER